MIHTIVSQPNVTVTPELTERCDRCGAAAKVTTTIAGSELSFCGHHANRFSDHLVAQAERIVVESGFVWRGAGQ